jgi:hypothetical protein
MKQAYIQEVSISTVLFSATYISNTPSPPTTIHYIFSLALEATRFLDRDATPILVSDDFAQYLLEWQPLTVDATVSRSYPHREEIRDLIQAYTLLH